MKQNYKTNQSCSKFDILKSKTKSLLIVSTLFLGTLNAQQSYTFTPCGATGSVGPTQVQVNSGYLTTNLNGSVVATAGIQSFTIPVSGGYRVEAYGAQGAGTAGGLGAIMIGDYTLTAGQVIKVLPGQMGESYLTNVNIGGGGGSYVVVGNNTIIAIAGGGGAANGTYTNTGGSILLNGMDGQFTGATVQGAGGLNGAGGGGASCRGGGGAGWLSAGGVGGCGAPGGQGGIPFLSGGFGGGLSGAGASGGFGGGGSAEGTNTAWTYAGGGGGYSGGGGASETNTTARAGGGGSIHNGINQSNTAAAHSGQGKVILRELCSIGLTASGSNSLNPSICAGQNVTLTTNGISNYAWSTGNTTNSTVVVSPAVTTVYTLSAMSPSNCVAAKSITVTVSSAMPVLTITNTANSICLGKTATLTAGGAVSYTWTGGVTNGQTFTPTATSGYTVTGQNGCGQSTSSTTITIAPLAVAVASSSNNICEGSPVVLTATAAVNGFTWMPGSLTGTNVTVAPLANTVYTLTASDGTCNGVATLTLNTKTIPVLSIVATSTDVCEGSAITMTVSGANTYTWSNPVSNNATVSDNPTSATSYIVSGTNANNCIASTSQIVVTKPNPVVNVSTNKSLVCADGAATLTASGGSSSYQWVNGPATNTNVVNPSVNTTYTVTGTGANACTTEKTITINVLSVSVTVSSASTTICEGASAVLNAGGATTYTWVGFGNFASATVSPTLTTTYTVNANTTSQGISCPSSNTIVITVNSLPTVSVSSTKTLVCRTDGSITITATGATSYVWSPTQTNNTLSVRPQSTTTYSVTGTDANGCQDGATIQIVVGPCTGIEEFKGGKTISVYPNPSNGDITVNEDSDITLKVMNDLGQLIQTITLNNQNDHKVSVKGLANGIYFIVGQNSTESVNEKIVVNK